jgi:hypothetical protein
MCFFSSPKPAQPAPLPPAPDPQPLPTPADTSPQNTLQQKNQMLLNMKKGLGSTILTEQKGQAGKGSDLFPSSPSGTTIGG